MVNRLVFYIFIFVSSPANSQVCSIKWNHDNLRVDETTNISNDNMIFEVKIRNIVMPIVLGSSRSYGWFSFGKCPPCNDVSVRALDKNNSDLKSEWAKQLCSPNKPVPCK